MWQNESVKTMFACQSQQSAAHADAQQHEESRKVADAHLKSLREKGVAITYLPHFISSKWNMLNAEDKNIRTCACLKL